MKKRLLLAGLALALGTGYTLTAFSQVKPEIMVKQRQAAMTLQGKYFGPMAGMGRGQGSLQRGHRRVQLIDARRPEQDAVGRFRREHQGRERENRRPAGDLERRRQVQGAQDNFQKAVQALVAVSRGGDEAGQKAAIGAVGKACGACHQDFREKQN